MRSDELHKTLKKNEIKKNREKNILEEIKNN